MRVIFIALALLLVFSGCIDDSGIVKNRIGCLKLSTQASGILPKCETETSCFSEINKYFDFGIGYFSADTKLLLQDYKNSIARSWLYYNRAAKNLENIYAACYSQANTSELSKNINELANNIDESFRQINTANELSFQIIAAEKQYLETININEIKEEELADDFIGLSDNLNQFQEKSPHKSDSYYYFYYQTMKEFEALGDQYDIKTTFVKENDLVDFAYKAGKKIMEKSRAEKTSIFFPFVVDFSVFLLEKIKKSKDIAEASNFLQKIPAFEFLKIYAKIASEKDSVNEHFIRMLAKISGDYSKTYEKTFVLSKEINQKIQKLEQELNSDFYEYEKIYSLSKVNQEIKNNRFFDFSKNKYDSFDRISSELLNLRIQSNSLDQQHNSGQLTVGIYLMKSKKINNILEILRINLGALKSDYLKKVEDVCSGKIKQISQNITGLQYPEIGKIKLRVSWFYDAQSFYEKTRHCEAVLEDYEKIINEIENKKENELKAVEESGDCLDFISGFNEILEKLPYSASMLTTDLNSPKNCERIKNKILEKAGQEIDMLEINPLFKKISDKLGFMKTISAYLENISGLESITKEFEDLGQYFTSNSFEITPENYPKAKSIKIRLKNLFEKISTEEKVQIKNFLEKNAQISSEAINAQQDSATYLNKAEFNVPFAYFEDEITMAIKTSESCEIGEKTSNLVVFCSADSIQVNFKEIPKGLSYFEWISEESINVDSILEFLGLDGKNALLVKTITNKAQKTLENFNFSEKLEDFNLEISKILILQNNNLIEFVRNDGKINFIATLGPNEITINYKLEDAIVFEKRLISHDKVSENKYSDRYELKVYNRLPFEADKISLSIMDYLPEDSIAEEKLCCSGELKHSGNSLLLKLSSLGPMETFEGIMEIVIKNYEENILALFARSELKLDSLKNSGFFEISKESNELAEGMQKLKDFADTKEKINELNKIADKILVLENKSKQLTLDEKEIRDRIEKSRRKIDEIKEFGIFADFDSELSQKAEVYLGLAEQAAQKQDFEESREYLGLAEQTISSAKISGAIEKGIGKNIAETISSLNELTSLGICCYDENIIKLVNDNRIFHENLAKKEFAKANEKYNEILAELELLQKDSNKKLNELIGSTRNKMTELRNLVDLGSLKEYSLLKKELKVFETVNFADLTYIPPMTLRELEAYEKEFAIIRKEITEKTDPMLELAYSNSQTENKKAIKGYNKNKESLNYSIAKAASIKDIIKNAYFELKEDASERLNSFESHGQNKDILDKAKKELVKGNLAKAITISGLAAGATANDQNDKNNLIMAISAALFLIIIIFAWVWFGRRNRKEPKKLKIFGQYDYV